MSSKAHESEVSRRFDLEIDTSGTRCPLPLLRAKQALKSMQSGDVLRVLATDAAAKPDFDAMLSHLPHKMIAYQRVSNQEVDARYQWVDHIWIQKGESEK